MPEGIFPGPAPSSRSALPFATLGELARLDGTVLVAAMPVTIWPAGSRVNRAGLHYDHGGDCPLAFFDYVAGANRRLALDGETYAVVDATAHTFLPHVELQLRRMRPAGS
jgi:hypothetical protein